MGSGEAALSFCRRLEPRLRWLRRPLAGVLMETGLLGAAGPGLPVVGLQLGRQLSYGEGQAGSQVWGSPAQVPRPWGPLSLCVPSAPLSGRPWASPHPALGHPRSAEGAPTSPSLRLLPCPVTRGARSHRSGTVVRRAEWRLSPRAPSGWGDHGARPWGSGQPLRAPGTEAVQEQVGRGPSEEGTPAGTGPTERALDPWSLSDTRDSQPLSCPPAPRSSFL